MTSRLLQEIKQNKPFPSIRQEAMVALARTASVLNHAFGQQLRAYGITMVQFNVLRILRGAGSDGLCRNDIGERLITPVPDVSRLLDRMVRDSLVTRNRGAEDRRTIKVCITPKGLDLLEVIDRSIASGPSQTLLSHMTDSEIKALLQLLELARTPPQIL